MDSDAPRDLIADPHAFRIWRKYIVSDDLSNPLYNTRIMLSLMTNWLHSPAKTIQILTYGTDIAQQIKIETRVWPIISSDQGFYTILEELQP